MALAVLASMAAGATSRAESRHSQVATIASYPHGAFLENLTVDPDGGILFTSYIDRRLMRWTGTGEPVALATLDAHPVGVIARARDIIASAHGLSFADGPAFMASNRLLVLDRGAKVIRSVEVPQAKFLNGMVALSANAILVADSLAGRIWRFDPVTGSVASWLSDPSLTVDAIGGGQRPGANGLKLRGGWLYISNSSRRTIQRIRVRNGQPAGRVQMVAADLPVDDFAFLRDGSIVAATHGAKLLRLTREGRVADILADGCDACTSVVPYGRGEDLIVLTTGNFIEGGDTPARVLRVKAERP